MKKEDFLSVIGEIDDKYIEEAEKFTQNDAKKCRRFEQRSIRNKWLKLGSLAAACLVVCVAAALLLHDWYSEEQDSAEKNTKYLPTLSVEHYTAKLREPEKKLGNPAVERDHSPWSEDASVDTLPVFENVAYAGSTEGEASQVSCESLNQEIMNAAECAGLHVNEIRYTRMKKSDDDKEHEKTQTSEPTDLNADAEENVAAESDDLTMACKAVAETDNGTIMTTSSRFTKIEYKKARELPEEYTVAKAELTDEKAEEITEYLLDEYGEMMDFSNPKANVYLFYDEDGNAVWNFAGYDGCEELKEQIVSYNLKQIRFQLDDQGRLTDIIMMDKLACGKKIEEYPIISSEEAKILLSRGEYVASSQEAPSLDNIESAGLVYLAGPECNLFMPYYAFDVRVDEETNDLFHYSTYYVPAVREEYLEKMPAAESGEE